jgi:hypothetical protein
MTELEAEYERRLEAYAEEHEDAFDEDDTTPEVIAGGLMPYPDELQASYAHFRLTLPPKIFARYKACKSALTIDHPGDIETASSPLTVSTLRFLLSRAGEGALVFPNDIPLVPTEEMLAKLQKKRGLDGFEDPKPKTKAKSKTETTATKTREPRPGEVRAARVVQSLEVLMNDPELALDLRGELRNVPKLTQKYAALLLEEGPMSDAKASKSLGATVEELAEVADELEQLLAELRE